MTPPSPSPSQPASRPHWVLGPKNWQLSISELFILKPWLSELRSLEALLITRRDSFNAEDG